MRQEAFSYQYFAKKPWYAILLQDRFISCFSDETVYACTSGQNFEVCESRRKELGVLVEDMMLACLWNTSRMENVPDDVLEHLKKRAGFCHYLETAPNEPDYFNKVWKTIDRPYEDDPELLTGEQLAVLVMMPFSSRMGGSFEEYFIRDGRMGRYLQALKRKTELPE